MKSMKNPEKNFSGTSPSVIPTAHRGGRVRKVIVGYREGGGLSYCGSPFSSSNFLKYSSAASW